VVRKLLAAALIVAAAAGFALSADEKPAPVPDLTYEVFLADTGTFLSAFGEYSQTPAPYAEAGGFYVPAVTAIRGLGGEVIGKTVSFMGTETDLSEFTGAEGEVFISAADLCSRFGLSMRRYGGLLQIGQECCDIPASERSAIEAQTGYTGYTDRAGEDTQELTEVTHIDPYRKSTVDNVISWIDSLEEAYPELVTSFTAGLSVEGREIKGFTMGRGERVIYMEAAIHPSEYVTSNVLMYIADRYLAGYRSGGHLDGYISFRELLDNFTFYIVPQLNPDGVNIVHNGFYASTLPVWKYDAQGANYPYQYKANANGVDLNRNFPYRWDPKLENNITWPCRRYYCGPYAASEPETQAVINVMNSIPAEAFLDFHKFGETISWHDSETDEAYVERYSALGNRLAADSGFDDVGEEYIEFGGYATNYNLHVNEVFACTVEICRFWNYNENRLDDVVRNIWRIGLVVGEELLKLDDVKEGLRIEADGRTVPGVTDGSRSDSFISAAQFTDAVAMMGGTAEVLEDGTAVLTLNGVTVARSCTDEVLDDGDVYVCAGGDTWFNATHMMAQAGGSAVLEGKTARFSSHW